MNLAILGFLLLSFLFPAGVLPQAEVLPRLVSPLPGEALQGVVNIQAEIDPAQTVRYELAFSYQDDPSGNWFLISEGQELPGIVLQATWDTTTISDGGYRLRLRVYLKNGLTSDVLVEGLRVRNYSPVETNTPTLTPVVTGTPLPPTATPAATITPSVATPLPPNPAGMDQSRVLRDIKNGFLVALFFFAVMGIYSGLRKMGRRREDR